MTAARSPHDGVCGTRTHCNTGVVSASNTTRLPDPPGAVDEGRVVSRESGYVSPGSSILPKLKNPNPETNN